MAARCSPAVRDSQSVGVYLQLLTLLALLLLLPPPLAVLQDEIGEMKAAEAQREKLLADVVRENRSLAEPLSKVGGWVGGLGWCGGWLAMAGSVRRC